ncbi:MAG: hypothetical protein AB7I18_09825 [Candidatus Berkiella sp.]
MFEKLDLNKVMYFKDNTTKGYKAALIELAEELGIAGEFSLSRLEETLNNALENVARSLMDPTLSNAAANETLVKFHRWAMNIHNDNLAPAPGQRFPFNIIFDMKGLVLSNPTADNALMRFVLEGFNGRKICKGNTPSADFISTSLLLEVLNNLPKPLSPAGRDFLAKYDSIAAFKEAQQLLVNGTTELSKGALFAFLASEKAFDFSKTINNETGANAYGLKESFNKGMKLLDQYPTDKLAADLKAMVSDIQTILTPVLLAFNSTRATQPARLLALWDASEWLCRLIVALQIAAEKDSQYKTALDSLMADPTIAEVYNRSMNGNFAANARNEAIKGVEVSEIYLQDGIAQQAYSKNTLKV